jgi:hypothetical protein
MMCYSSEKIFFCRELSAFRYLFSNGVRFAIDTWWMTCPGSPISTTTGCQYVGWIAMQESGHGVNHLPEDRITKNARKTAQVGECTIRLSKARLHNASAELELGCSGWAQGFRYKHFGESCVRSTGNWNHLRSDSKGLGGIVTSPCSQISTLTGSWKLWKRLLEFDKIRLSFQALWNCKKTKGCGAEWRGAPYEVWRLLCSNAIVALELD